MIFLDTHVVVWLYNNASQKLSQDAKQLINEHDVFISPIVQLELVYLYEIGRLSQPATVAVQFLTQALGLAIQDTSLQVLVSKAETLSWTRDPFDRLIVAHASLMNNLLLTKDKLILSNYSEAKW